MAILKGALDPLKGGSLDLLGGETRGKKWKRGFKKRGFERWVDKEKDDEH